MGAVQPIIVAIISLSLNHHAKCSGQMMTMKGLKFQENGQLDENSTLYWAKIDPELPSLNEFSVCLWFKLFFERLYSPLWSYCAKPQFSLSEDDICYDMVMEHLTLTTSFANAEISIDLTPVYKRHKWNHICATFQADGEYGFKFKLYFNGENIMSKVKHTKMSMNRLYGGGIIVLGQKQETMGGYFEEQQSLSGAISGFNMWREAIPLETIDSLVNCSQKGQGDALNWANATWNTSMIEVISVEMNTELCQALASKSYFIFPERRSFQEANRLCTFLGGKLMVPNEEVENRVISNIALQFNDTCEADDHGGKTVWIGIQPDNRGRWMDISDAQEVRYFNWKEGQGDGNDNSAVILTGRSELGEWASAFSSLQSPRRYCAMCEFLGSDVKFYLIGLCKESSHDRFFYLFQNGTGKPYFKGQSSSIIFWNEAIESWELKHLEDESYAIFEDDTTKSPNGASDPESVNYPIGRKIWKAFDDKCGSAADGFKLNLTLTRCDETQFTCNDGTCQPLDFRCDMKPDCPDRSDENLCRKTLVPDDYEMNLPPKIIGSVPVTLQIEILSFDKIDMLNSILGIIMSMNLTWLDQRLEFFNLRNDSYENMISTKEKVDIWIPEIGLDNAKTGTLSKDDHTTLKVNKLAQALPWDFSRHREEAVYSASENELNFFRRIHAEYHCNFNVRYFPFDHHECKLIFNMRTATKTMAILKSGGVMYDGPTVLTEFKISNISITEGSPDLTRSELVVKIQLERLYKYHLSQGFFQSWLLGFLSYLTFWIDIRKFNDRFMGSLTALLVLTSLISTLTGSLPKTSYFKMIDIWLFFYICLAAINIGLHILIDQCYRRETKHKVHLGVQENDLTLTRGYNEDVVEKDTLVSEVINNIQKVGWPILTIGFVLIFFVNIKINNDIPSN